MTDPLTFADINLANLTEAEAKFVQANTPEGAQAHIKPGFVTDRFMVLVEDASIEGARDLFTALAGMRREVPDVPNWRDVRTGTAAAWRTFADAKGIHYPAGSSRTRIAVAVQSWLENAR